MLESLDHQMAEMARGHPLQMKPSEYFQRNFYACFWFETDDISHMIRRVGVDNVLFETDFPHPSCLFPLDDVEARLSGLTETERVKVLSANAAKLYRIAIS
jgi:predicted TIM-barrel fold metal-dependent hydrolase